MIAINHLRIGNIITDCSGKPQRVVMLQGQNQNYNAGCIETDVMCERGTAWFEPLLLTNEILEAVGFVKSINNPTIHLLRIGDTNFMLSERKYGRFYCSERIIPCRYVHELQNLFFALTGDELNIPLL